MSEDRQRFVYKEWVRDPKGKLLEKPPPRGKRTENNIIWGHSLDDFYWIPRIPGVNVLTIWSRSMIQAFGENYLKERHDPEPEPRRLRPWPVLTLPEHLSSASELGYIDEGCTETHSRAPRRVQDEVVETPNATAATGTPLSSLYAVAMDIDAPSGENGDSPKGNECGPASVVEQGDAPKVEASGADTAKPDVDGRSLCTVYPTLSLIRVVGMDVDIDGRADNGVLPEASASCLRSAWGSLDDAESPQVLQLRLPPIFHDLPKLEEFIPEAYFPDILYVNDPDEATMASSHYYYSRMPAVAVQSQERVPRKYKRPAASSSGPAPATCAPPVVPDPSTNLRIAHLNLSGAPFLGVGNHSVVHRAALRLPRPLGARSPTGEVTVAAKTGFPGSEARQLLLNEGKIYGAFPAHLMEDWCGLNLVAPITHPVPVHAVVPKFYGYYVPVREDIEREKQEAVRRFKLSGSYKAWQRMSPILLLEECGTPIVPITFTPDARSECYSMALRLHYAEFTQGSFYVRNFLMQPGPLTVAPSARSTETPSFRIIDFGRGEHWPYQLEAAKTENELRRKKSKTTLRELMKVPTEEEMKQRVEEAKREDAADERALKAAGKAWWESRDYEVRKAHSELRIRDFHC
ncbi:hypothetical protein B0H15DRAFT_792105 [Mycena belliarum]|uniref:Uncharacterized protein n=1 Tax=Mycena belliarum TaxID=1033014 RepID=A0AAD6XJC1_9AGAR|nr:hypothetical protein B0H15DRAFT_792105 [Mycena belliae]